MAACVAVHAPSLQEITELAGDLAGTGEPLVTIDDVRGAWPPHQP